jgi:hypothetical protein
MFPFIRLERKNIYLNNILINNLICGSDIHPCKQVGWWSSILRKFEVIYLMQVSNRRDREED